MVVAPRTLRQTFPGHHPVQWRTASPLWSAMATKDPATILQPAILRFTTDTFMEDFLTVVTQAPQRLGEWQVQPETWRKPAPVPPLPPHGLSLPADLTPPELSSQPVKLYQPAHQRYYLVVANLVCHIPGFPDRILRTNNQEQVTFVLRRQMQDAADKQVKEHALVNDHWQPVGSPATQLVPGEAKFPMFPATYREANGYRRCIFSGLIPVGERERYLNAPRQLSQDAAASLGNRLDQLVTILTMDVAAPWRELLRQVGDDPVGGVVGPMSRTLQTSLQEISLDGSVNQTVEREKVRQTALAQRDQLQGSSWYILLDFASFLQTYLPQVWAVIQGKATETSLPTAQRNLYTALHESQFRPGDASFVLTQNDKYYELLIGQVAPNGIPIRLTEALVNVDAINTKTFLEGTTLTYDTLKPDGGIGWPSSRYLLTGRGMRSLLDRLDDTHDPITRALTAPGLIRLALAEESTTATRPIPQTPIAQDISLTANALDVSNDQFVIRCVLERPNCPPSIYPTVVSNSTQPFQMASYFDPEAPARPIRIVLPIDTTPAGLRKFAKNTAFVMSDTLACQVEKAKSLTFGDLVLSVLPWPFNRKLNTSGASCDASGSLNFGKICTLSIPIITICALILLIIFVLLLDIIFKWVPYLIFCLPLPGLKAKK